MITRKKIKIPIFNYSLEIIIFDKWFELEPYIPRNIFEESSLGVTINLDMGSIVCIDSKRPSTIVHEAGHLTNSVWRYIGYIPDRDNDEVSQYLLTYIYERINEVFRKHITR